MFMHYLPLLLEKIADRFPLSMKLDGYSSLLVHQIVHQCETFHLESRGRNAMANAPQLKPSSCF